MKDLLRQLGYVLFEEYQWNETQNLCFDNHKKKWDAIPLVLASCTNINDASTSAPLVLFQHEELWETPFWSMNGLETRPLKWIEQKKTETGRENIIELVTMSSHLLLDWMATTCSNKPEVNSIELKAWMEDILEETWDVYQSLVQHLYDDWKVQCQNHHLREQSKRHPFHLQDMTSTYLVKKNMPLKPISTWKRDTKQSTSILSSHENVLLHNTIEYDNPLDDFLDITGNEKQERIRQKYHPDLEESLHTCLQEKSSNKWDGCVSPLPCESLSDATCCLHIPKDICISKELISVAQRLVGHKSFLLLPPPLEIFLIGVVMVYHYLTAMENRPRCLWIAQDEYPFVAALLKQRIGSQLVWNIVT